jgi:hypothetical protein
MAIVLIWRGIQQGWQPAIPQARPLAVAERRLALLQRIKGQEHTFKLAPHA